MNLYDRLLAQSLSAPDAVAIKFEDKILTFAEIAAAARNLAARLQQDFAIAPGDRVSWLGLNHPHMLICLFACARLGAIFSPFNTRLAREEYRYLLGNGQPNICVYDQNFANMAMKLASAGRFVSMEELFSGLKADTTTTGTNIEGDQPSRVDASETLLLVYTSGTTGRPKGVMLSHRAVWANIENCQALYDFKPGQNVLITLPLFHVGGLCILLLPALMHGASIHLHARFDPALTMETLEYQAITTTILVPAQMAAIMALDQWSRSKFNSLAYVVVGSSLIPLEQIQNWHRKNIPVSQVYGATETGPASIALDIADARAKEGAAGKEVAHCQVKIVDLTGNEVKPGERGEVLVRGENVMSGYWCDQTETDRVLCDGWYATGDVALQDEDGFFWIVDRLKDVIISGGENIYPAEIEAVSLAHPAIAAIAIIGRPHPRWGESPVAIIECTPGETLSAPEYIDFLQDKIARYKQPKEVIFTDAMPRNGMGKIEKSALRQRLKSD